MSGFSKHSGPAGPPSSQLPRFGNFTSTPPQSPPFPHFSAARSPSPRGSPVPTDRAPLVYDSLIYESPHPAASTAYQSTGFRRKPQNLQRVRSPPLYSERTQTSASPPIVNVEVHRPAVSSPQMVNGQRSFFEDDEHTNPRPSAVTSFVLSRSSGPSTTAKISRFQDLKRTRSPTSHALGEDIFRNSDGTFVQSHSVDNGNHSGPARTRFLTVPFQNDNSFEQFHPSPGAAQPPASLQSARDNQIKFSNNNSNLLARQNQSSALPNVGSFGHARNFLDDVGDVPMPKHTTPLANEVFQKNTRVFQNESRRLGPRQNARSSTYDSENPQRTFPSANGTAVEAAPTKTTHYSVAKRTRSPPWPADEAIRGNLFYTQEGTEREIEAKTKRLARFKQELSENFENKPDIAEQKASASRHEQSIAGQQKLSGSHSLESGDFTNGNLPSEYDGLETSGIIIGMCPDMCPVSEREERERKGDLDQYERFEGDRNQTNKFLAVKKYNRTAEREASLIRPMPVLQKTVDYLLDLLDQPYDDRFLGMYNFLWDRMRAIRMDLRMQHIFNQEAITMLEQMIRLHIIAMHELCEYTKGEGFSEGFDAHLNIEQMNKTSVDLFQMYDDHRKNGINVPTEKEFRGYYALLKLDKHPGYKVEPAELSLDLAKMTPEIRQTPEVLFARDVARACRTGNFIAFFRLARKASYLQACLMHAHFAKLRTQALASLHAGLPNNQGIPVRHVAKWIAMEEEDIEGLLEYHGFSIKEFEEPYMVKDGPFASADQDYPTKLSKLVHTKKSMKIIDDVSPTSEMASLPAQASEDPQVSKICKLDKKTDPFSFADRETSAVQYDEEMPDFEVASSPKVFQKLQPMVEKSKIFQQIQEHQQVEGAPATIVSSWGFSSVYSPPVYPDNLKKAEKPYDDVREISFEKKMLPIMEVMPLQVVPKTAALLEKSSSAKFGFTADDAIPQFMAYDNSKDESHDVNQEREVDEIMENSEDEIVAREKLKLIIRLWKRRASKQRELREQRQIVANAALSSLSLGPPIRQAKDQMTTANEFDIEYVMRERYEKHEQFWSRLNVSEVAAKILGKRNPGVSFLCWKIVLCSQMNNQGDQPSQKSYVMHASLDQWLQSKLMPSGNDDDDILISSSGLLIWKNWVSSQLGSETCCLSVVRNVLDDSKDTVDGAGAVIFLVSESIPWDVQKGRLQKLLMSIPSGSWLPLLVLCDSCNKEVSDPYNTIISELGLHEIDKSRVSSFLVVFLADDQENQCFYGFFSDVRLREGLQWLASESPLQLDVHRVNTRDLILTYLNSSLNVLEKMSDKEVGPNHCISGFNDALDWSLGEITAAAKSNPVSWPCPEITLLPESCDEYTLVKWYLPSIGWSLAEKVEPLLSAVRKSKLPLFSDDMSWLNKGANSGDEIEDLRSQLENCLIKYLTESSGMMSFNMAIKEAYVMLQKSARLELQESTYIIVPKWISIFRRIFNWRLTSLSKGAFSSAYVLRHHHVDPAECIPDEFQLESTFSPPYVTWPSLDEIIAGCTNPLLPTSGQPLVEAFQPSKRTVLNGNIQGNGNRNDLVEDERMLAESDHPGTRISDPASTEVIVSGNAAKVTNKLSKLLEHCNILQNSIDDKLSIYF